MGAGGGGGALGALKGFDFVLGDESITSSTDTGSGRRHLGVRAGLLRS